MATCDPEQLMEDGVLFQGLSRRDLEILKNQLLCEIANAGGGSGASPAVSVVDGTAFGDIPAVGTSTRYARQDHSHGTPTEPTPDSIGAAEVASIGCPVGVNEESGTSLMLSLSHIGRYFRLTNGSSCTITVPANASVDWASEAYPPTIAFRVAAAGIPTLSSTATINDPKGIIASLVTGDTFALQWVASDVWDVV